MPGLPPPGDLSRHPVDVGQRSEAAVLSELVRRGYHVLTPFGVNHRYDFVIDAGDGFLRVQCKTGRFRNGCVEFSTQSVRINTRAVFTRGYDARSTSSSSTARRSIVSMLSRSKSRRAATCICVWIQR
jgi:hypothetical protein